MKAFEIWINGERKCVAGTGDDVLTAIANGMRRPHLSVGGIMEKDGASFYVRWLSQTLQVGDEVRIRLVEADEVDEPINWRPRQTQAQKDDEVRTSLESLRDSLPAPLVETATSSLSLLNERLAQNNCVEAMEILGELGKQNVVSVQFWKSLENVASLLSRHDSGDTFHAQSLALEAAVGIPQVESAAQREIGGQSEAVGNTKKAFEIWINDERKCVASTGDSVLAVIVNGTHKPNVRVGGLMEKDGASFHVGWLNEPLQIGDEVRVRLVETDEVDEPTHWKPMETQAQQDDEVRTKLESLRDSLPDSINQPKRPQLPCSMNASRRTTLWQRWRF